MKNRFFSLIVVLLCVSVSSVSAQSLRSSTPNAQDGLKVNYYHISSNDVVLPDFDSISPFASEIRENFAFIKNKKKILNSGLKDFVALSLEGFLDVPTDGEYSLYLFSDDGSKLFLDGDLIIDNDGLHVETEKVCVRHLKQGLHSIKILYMEATQKATLTCDWSGPNIPREHLNSAYLWYAPQITQEMQDALNLTKDSDGDGLPNVQEIALGTNINSTDSDEDGISDYDELITYSTNPVNDDSDGDGISDYDEIFSIYSNPNAQDISDQIIPVLSLNGSDAAVVYGSWVRNNGSIYASTINGAVKYKMQLESEGVFRLKINISSLIENSGDSSFKINLTLDGVDYGTQKIICEQNNATDAFFYLVNLKQGVHEAVILWKNTNIFSYVKINSIALQQLNGPDSDENGIPDWLDSRNENLKVINIPISSAVSPVCVDGNDHINIGSMTVSGYFVPEDDDDILPPTLKTLPHNKWYANIPLSPAAPTVLSFNYSDGPVTKTVTWSETNVFNSSNTTIRLNDSLLLTACPQNQTAGTAVIDIDGQSFSIDYDAANSRNSIPYEFETSGDLIVNASFTPEDGSAVQYASMNVKVVESHFANPPVSLIYKYRTWDNPALTPESFVEADDFIRFYESSLNEGRKIDFSIVKDKKGCFSARLAEDGPVLDSVEVNVIEFNPSPRPKMQVIDFYDDGVMLIENTISLSYVPPDLKILIKILTPGITLEDGSLEMWVTADDFDQFGKFQYRLLVSTDVTTSPCHKIKLYQGDVKLQKY